ncbi:uncharacterized protein LOC116129669 isoform X2 [Pistacia vera]|uniref:uncharacterized protein LOC116129669 isoform X2 n=1 Tax=Pistacia vera TaxID=55513 RepID=UPI001262AFD2|nr:uncharacterized protein LOC116129669 isoform X2 [Pistacia vera]
MRILASRLSTHLCRRRSGHVQSRNFSSRNVKDEIFIKHRRVRWFVNSVTATYLVYLFGLPFMGDNLKMRHAMLLLESNFPFVKAVGAHKVARFATDDERRMNIVEIGGAQELVYMLGDAEDYYTRIEALKALAALSGSVERQTCVG